MRVAIGLSVFGMNKEQMVKVAGGLAQRRSLIVVEPKKRDKRPDFRALLAQHITGSIEPV